MNCKQGDLAIVVMSEAGNEGRIVRCVKFVGKRRWHSKYRGMEELATWNIDPPLASWMGNLKIEAPDCALRPIRDQHGDDETLAWAGKPEQVAA